MGVSIKDIPAELVGIVYDFIPMPRDQLAFSLVSMVIFKSRPRRIELLHKWLQTLLPARRSINSIKYTCDWYKNISHRITKNGLVEVFIFKSFYGERITCFKSINNINYQTGECNGKIYSFEDMVLTTEFSNISDPYLGFIFILKNKKLV